MQSLIPVRPLTIGEVARRAGIGVETVRFYEKEGLIDEPARKESGYRQYREDVVARLRFIRRAKELGFSLKDIKELLALRIEPRTPCAEVKKRARAKIADVQEKIDALQRIKEALEKLTATCNAQAPISECPILEAIEHAEENA